MEIMKMVTFRSFIAALIMVGQVVSSLYAEDVVETKQSQTYVQDYCGFTITLPDGWKGVLDEKDIDIKSWGYTKGLYTYNPQPGKQPGQAEWIYLKDPGVYLVVRMVKREPGIGFSRYVDSVLYSFMNEDWKILNKGSMTVDSKPCKWWQMNFPKGGDIYALCLGNKEYFYLVTFTTLYVSPELKSQFDDIMQTFKFTK